MKGEKKHFLKRNKGFKVGHMQHFKSLELKWLDTITFWKFKNQSNLIFTSLKREHQ
jgi:hypothetical protein